MSNIPMTVAEAMPQMRLCKGDCAELRPETDYYRGKHGLDGKCKECRRKDRGGNAEPALSPAEAEAIGRALFSTFRAWQGGEPRSDWRADTGWRAGRWNGRRWRHD